MYWDDIGVDDEVTAEEYYQEHPEGFVWSCCEKKGDDEEGCRFSRHVSDPRRSKRARTSTGAARDDEVGSLSSWTEHEQETEVEESEEEDEDDDDAEDDAEDSGRG